MQKINIIGEIDEKAVERFIEDVKALDYEDGVLIQFDSNGGYVDSGYDLADLIIALKQRTNVVAVNSGNIMSAATIPYLVCTYRMFDPSKGDFLIHQASLEGLDGNGDELLKAAISTLSVDNELAEFYSAVGGKPAEIYLERMEKDEPLSVDEMVELGFVDEILA